jgi:cobalt-zinc-cadmium efflux system outer membrane protein
MKWTRSTIILIVIAVTLAGCATFRPKPISPEQRAAAFEARALDSSGLREFLRANLGHDVMPWPPKTWDFQKLTLAAFYYHPDLDVARAKWSVAKAGVITAGGRANPSIGFIPEYNVDAAHGISPWKLPFKFDIPVETAGKRGYRIDQAKYLSEAARLTRPRKEQFSG